MKNVSFVKSQEPEIYTKAEEFGLMVLLNMRMIFEDTEELQMEFYAVNESEKHPLGFKWSQIPVFGGRDLQVYEDLKLWTHKNMPESVVTACLCARLDHERMLASPDVFLEEDSSDRALVVHIATMCGTQTVFISDIVEGEPSWPPVITRCDAPGSVSGDSLYPQIYEMGFEA